MHSKKGGEKAACMRGRKALRGMFIKLCEIDMERDALAASLALLEEQLAHCAEERRVLREEATEHGATVRDMAQQLESLRGNP